MKTTKYILLLTSLLFIIIGCTSKQTREESPYGDEVNIIDDIKLELNKDSYKSADDEFELTIVNETDAEISYGAPYTIEVKNNDTWYIVEPNEEISFIMIAYILQPGEVSTESINMEYYEPFEKGEYRLVRQIDGETFTVEFEVTEN